MVRYFCLILLSSIFVGCCCCHKDANSKESADLPAGPSERTARDPDGPTGSEARPPESPKTDPKK